MANNPKEIAARVVAIGQELVKKAQAQLEEAQSLREKAASESESLKPLIKEAVDSLITGDWIEPEHAEQVTQKLASEGGFQASVQLLRDLASHHRSQTSTADGPGTPVGPIHKQAAAEDGVRRPFDRRRRPDDTTEGQDFIRNLYNPARTY